MTPTQTSVQPEYVCGPDAARMLNISYGHLRGLLRKGEGPASIRLGNRLLFSPGTLRRFMADKEK